MSVSYEMLLSKIVDDVGLERIEDEFIESTVMSADSYPAFIVDVAGDPHHIASQTSKYKRTTLPCPLFFPLSTAALNSDRIALNFGGYYYFGNIFFVVGEIFSDILGVFCG